MLNWRALQSLGRQHRTWWCPRDITTSKTGKNKLWSGERRLSEKGISDFKYTKGNLYPLPSKWVKYKTKYRAFNQRLFSEKNLRQHGCTITSLPGKTGGHLPQGYTQIKGNFQLLYHYFFFFLVFCLGGFWFSPLPSFLSFKRFLLLFVDL